MPGEIASAREEVIRRFAHACLEESRIVAAFVGGSNASGTADAHADIDLYVILADDGYDAFFAGRDAFIDRLGSTVFRETLNLGFDVVAFIMADGVDGEVIFHRLSEVGHLQLGPILPVLDRVGILPEQSFPIASLPVDEMAADVRIALVWFWRDLLQFGRAIHRGRPWTAYGFLGKLRDGCQFMIVQADESERPPDRFVPMDWYDALDHIPATREAELLRASVVPLERDAMVAAARTLVEVMTRIGPGVAATHGLNYPEAAARVVQGRLDEMIDSWNCGPLPGECAGYS